jgi:hypothetical protein
MRYPSFLEGAGVALAAALTISLGQAALTLVMPAGTALRLLAALVSLAYLLYLLRRSPERVGRAVTVAAWTAAAGLLWLAAPSPSLYLSAHLVLLWLARSLYFHPGPLAALADLGLTGLAGTAAVGAWLHSGSLFLAVWCLFLGQALFVLIPHVRGSDPSPQLDRFERAHRSAESALRKLSTY